MTRIAIATLAVALGLGGASQAAADDCKMVKTGELPLKFERNKALVQVAINGKPAWFAIDTGSSNSIVTSAAAKSFDLTESSAGRLKFYGFGGLQDAREVTIAEFGLGGVKVKDFRILSLVLGSPTNYSGLLGRDFLSRLGDIEFDLADGALRFWKADQCQHRSLAYWTKAPAMAELRHADDHARYMVKVQVNGKAANAELDSGTGTSIITPAIARQAGVPPEKYEPGVEYLSGIGRGKVEMHIANFDSVAVGQEEVKHTRLRVADFFEQDTQNETASKVQHRITIVDQPDMILGADFLRSHRVLVASSQGLLYFTYIGGQIFEVVGDAVKPADTVPEPANK